MSKAKVSVIGAGNVGATVGQLVLNEGLGDVVLVDIVEGLAEGKALDLSESAPVAGLAGRVTGGTDFDLIRDSVVVVVTSGVPRKPGMSRDDLLATNAEIIRAVAEKIRSLAPNAFVLMVANPLDVMTYLAWKVTGFPSARVAGMAGVLDSTRFAWFVSREMGVSPRDVQAMVMGGHGDTMVPLPRYTTVSGVPITDLLPADRIAGLVQRTRDGGAEIVALLKRGSAYYAPAASAVAMVRSYLKDEKRLLPGAAVLDGEYGEEDVCLGVPLVIGSAGIERVAALVLDGAEKEALHRSAEAVRGGIAVLRQRGFLP